MMRQKVSKSRPAQKRYIQQSDIKLLQESIILYLGSHTGQEVNLISFNRLFSKGIRLNLQTNFDLFFCARIFENILFIVLKNVISTICFGNNSGEVIFI